MSNADRDWEENKSEKDGQGVNIALTSLALILLMVVLGVLMMLVQR